MLANRRNWDARTPIHVASRFYAMGSDDPSFWFAPFEWDDLGELAGRDVVHLQCHLGTETVAFARRGARSVTGLDFSERSVTAARELAARTGDAVEYVCANVYDAVDALGAGRFDVVYTGKGSMCYLPDLPRWARTVAGLLRPGGLVYVVEFHPVLNALGVKPHPAEGADLVLRYGCLGGSPAVERDATYTYTDGPALEHDTVAYEWMHGVGDVANALVGAGLRLTGLRESELLPWPRWPRMVRHDGWWRLPDADPKIPLFYALAAEATPR